MRYFYITFRSITYAQRGERSLQRAGIPCALQRTPKVLQERGCSYCLRVRGGDVLSARDALERDNAAYVKIYEMLQGQPPREVVL